MMSEALGQTKAIYRYSYPTIAHTATHETTSAPVQHLHATGTLGQDRQPAETKGIKERFVIPTWQRLPLKATELIAQWSRALHYY
jgi:hypothetical protein